MLFLKASSVGVVGHTCNLSTWESMQKDQEVQASLGYTERPCLKSSKGWGWSTCQACIWPWVQSPAHRKSISKQVTSLLSVLPLVQKMNWTQPSSPLWAPTSGSCLFPTRTGAPCSSSPQGGQRDRPLGKLGRGFRGSVGGGGGVALGDLVFLLPTF
jgi:hypothetical protein